MLVKFIAPPSPSDRTEQIQVSKSRFLVLGGPALDITMEQYRSIVQNGYQLQVIEDEAQTEPEPIVVDVPSDPEPEVQQTDEVFTNSPAQSYGASPTSPFGADQEEG